MTYKIRKWELSDARDLALALSNTKIQDNLRDGLPYPYTEQDGADYISVFFVKEIFTDKPPNWDITSQKNIGAEEL